MYYIQLHTTCNKKHFSSPVCLGNCIFYMETFSTYVTTGGNKNYSSSHSNWTDEPCGFVPTNVNSITSRSGVGLMSLVDLFPQP